MNNFNQDEDDWGCHRYSDEEEITKILEVATKKVDNLYNGLEEIKGIEIYKFNITNIEIPQTAFKIYSVATNCDEIVKILIGILDVSIDAPNSILEFCFYNLSGGSTLNEYAKFINGAWHYNDSILVPLELQEFNTENIDNLIEDIINMY